MQSQCLVAELSVLCYNGYINFDSTREDNSLSQTVAGEQYMCFIIYLYRAIMKDVARDNRLLSFVSKSGLKNLLVTMLDQLHRCQKSLNEFLEVWWWGYQCARRCLWNLVVIQCFSLNRRRGRCFRGSISLVMMTYWRFWASRLTPASYKRT